MRPCSNRSRYMVSFQRTSDFTYIPFRAARPGRSTARVPITNFASRPVNTKECGDIAWVAARELTNSTCIVVSTSYPSNKLSRQEA